MFTVTDIELDDPAAAGGPSASAAQESVTSQRGEPTGSMNDPPPVAALLPVPSKPVEDVDDPDLEPLGSTAPVSASLGGDASSLADAPTSLAPGHSDVSMDSGGRSVANGKQPADSMTLNMRGPVSPSVSELELESQLEVSPKAQQAEERGLPWFVEAGMDGDSFIAHVMPFVDPAERAVAGQSREQAEAAAVNRAVDDIVNLVVGKRDGLRNELRARLREALTDDEHTHWTRLLREGLLVRDGADWVEVRFAMGERTRADALEFGPHAGRDWVTQSTSRYGDMTAKDATIEGLEHKGQAGPEFIGRKLTDILSLLAGKIQISAGRIDTRKHGTAHELQAGSRSLANALDTYLADVRATVSVNGATHPTQPTLARHLVVAYPQPFAQRPGQEPGPWHDVVDSDAVFEVNHTLNGIEVEPIARSLRRLLVNTNFSVLRRLGFQKRGRSARVARTEREIRSEYMHEKALKDRNRYLTSGTYVSDEITLPDRSTAVLVAKATLKKVRHIGAAAPVLRDDQAATYTTKTARRLGTKAEVKFPFDNLLFKALSVSFSAGGGVERSFGYTLQDQFQAKTAFMSSPQLGQQRYEAEWAIEIAVQSGSRKFIGAVRASTRSELAVAHQHAAQFEHRALGGVQTVALAESVARGELPVLGDPGRADPDAAASPVGDLLGVHPNDLKGFMLGTRRRARLVWRGATTFVANTADRFSSPSDPFTDHNPVTGAAELAAYARRHGPTQVYLPPEVAQLRQWQALRGSGAPVTLLDVPDTETIPTPDQTPLRFVVDNTGAVIGALGFKGIDMPSRWLPQETSSERSRAAGTSGLPEPFTAEHPVRDPDEVAAYARAHGPVQVHLPQEVAGRPEWRGLGEAPESEVVLVPGPPQTRAVPVPDQTPLRFVVDADGAVLGAYRGFVEPGGGINLPTAWIPQAVPDGSEGPAQPADGTAAPPQARSAAPAADEPFTEQNPVTGAVELTAYARAFGPVQVYLPTEVAARLEWQDLRNSGAPVTVLDGPVEQQATPLEDQRPLLRFLVDDGGTVIGALAFEEVAPGMVVPAVWKAQAAPEEPAGSTPLRDPYEPPELASRISVWPARVREVPGAQDVYFAAVAMLTRMVLDAGVGDLLVRSGLSKLYRDMALRFATPALRARFVDAASGGIDFRIELGGYEFEVSVATRVGALLRPSTVEPGESIDVQNRSAFAASVGEERGWRVSGDLEPAWHGHVGEDWLFDLGVMYGAGHGQTRSAQTITGSKMYFRERLNGDVRRFDYTTPWGVYGVVRQHDSLRRRPDPVILDGPRYWTPLRVPPQYLPVHDGPGTPAKGQVVQVRPFPLPSSPDLTERALAGHQEWSIPSGDLSGLSVLVHGSEWLTKVAGDLVRRHAGQEPVADRSDIPIEIREGLRTTNLPAQFEAMLSPDAAVIMLPEQNGWNRAVSIRLRLFNQRYEGRRDASTEDYLETDGRYSVKRGFSTKVAEVSGGVSTVVRVFDTGHDAQDPAPAHSVSHDASHAPWHDPWHGPEPPHVPGDPHRLVPRQRGGGSNAPAGGGPARGGDISDANATSDRLLWGPPRPTWEYSRGRAENEIGGNLTINMTTYAAPGYRNRADALFEITSFRWQGDGAAHTARDSLWVDGGVLVGAPHVVAIDLGFDVPAGALADEPTAPPPADTRTAYVKFDAALALGTSISFRSHNLVDKIKDLLVAHGALARAQRDVPTATVRGVTNKFSDRALRRTAITLKGGAIEHTVTVPAATLAGRLAGNTRKLKIKVTAQWGPEQYRRLRSDASATMGGQSFDISSESQESASSWSWDLFKLAGRRVFGDFRLNLSGDAGTKTESKTETEETTTGRDIRRIAVKPSPQQPQPPADGQAHGQSQPVTGRSEEFTHDLSLKVELFDVTEVHEPARLVGDALRWVAKHVGGTDRAATPIGTVDNIRGRIKALVPQFMVRDEPQPATSAADPSTERHPQPPAAVPDGPQAFTDVLSKYVLMIATPQAAQVAALAAGAAAPVAGSTGTSALHPARVDGDILAVALSENNLRTAGPRLLHHDLTVPSITGDSLRQGFGVTRGTPLARFHATELNFPELAIEAETKRILVVQQAGRFDLHPQWTTGKNWALGSGFAYDPTRKSDQERTSSAGDYIESNFTFDTEFLVYEFEGTFVTHGRRDVSVGGTMYGILPKDVAEELNRDHGTVFGDPDDPSVTAPPQRFLPAVPRASTMRQGPTTPTVQDQVRAREAVEREAAERARVDAAVREAASEWIAVDEVHGAAWRAEVRAREAVEREAAERARVDAAVREAASEWIAVDEVHGAAWRAEVRAREAVEREAAERARVDAAMREAAWSADGVAAAVVLFRARLWQWAVRMLEPRAAAADPAAVGAKAALADVRERLEGLHGLLGDLTPASQQGVRDQLVEAVQAYDAVRSRLAGRGDASLAPPPAEELMRAAPRSDPAAPPAGEPARAAGAAMSNGLAANLVLDPPQPATVTLPDVLAGWLAQSSWQEAEGYLRANVAALLEPKSVEAMRRLRLGDPDNRVVAAYGAILELVGQAGGVKALAESRYRPVKSITMMEPWPAVDGPVPVTFAFDYLAPKPDRQSRKPWDDRLLRLMYQRQEFRGLAVVLARGVVERGQQPVQGQRSGLDYGGGNATVFAAVDKVLRMSVTRASRPGASGRRQEFDDVSRCALAPQDKAFWVLRLDELRDRVRKSGIPGHPDRHGVAAPAHAALLDLLTDTLANCSPTAVQAGLRSSGADLDTVVTSARRRD
ncbi:hypothetical protein [Dactylosporangium sp. CA-233914]|uniref:hypothetical protein n=1 Tax=Dactylosporangium sp. CA-233914 TaxID=3239934 RepID=UPI003D94DEC8